MQQTRKKTILFFITYLDGHGEETAARRGATRGTAAAACGAA